eukprot:TRINITY_DN940_c0_g1_i3.p1 TRINITY_DN940_c0_g1~~TRINITY_DN940_c0_g1_i3.p1  ORF type:complete len:143 (+),score=36.40 TRINITY_DN940_c0_g1_i3:237-665(+)
MGMDPVLGLGDKSDDVPSPVGIACEELHANAFVGKIRTFEECPDKLKAVISQSFTRYDLDDSGWIDGEQELHQLCTNLAYSLRLDRGFEFIWEEVKVVGKNVRFDVPKFAEWFLSRFMWEFVDDGTTLICSGLSDWTGNGQE